MSLPKILIVLVFIAVVYNLGAALYYMTTDRGQSGRTVRSLTWRIGLSVGLILLVVAGIFTGVIEPHGVRVGR
jgi:small neutral amino acid transporter SnatA (MarC family)